MSKSMLQLIDSFVNGIKQRLRLIFFNIDTQLIWYHLFKKKGLSFPPVTLVYLLKIKSLCECGSFSGLCVPLISRSNLMLRQSCFAYYSLVVSLEVGKQRSSNYLLFKYCSVMFCIYSLFIDRYFSFICSFVKKTLSGTLYQTCDRQHNKWNLK